MFTTRQDSGLCKMTMAMIMYLKVCICNCSLTNPKVTNMKNTAAGKSASNNYNLLLFNQ